jgi:hypothetical protein
MRSSFKTVAIAALLLAASTTPALAAPAKPTMVLSLTPKDSLSIGHRVTLGCDTDATTGTHPRRDLACSAIDLARGEFEQLPATGQNCPMIYDPVVARATGTWHGKPVTFENTFVNSCAAAAESGDVFRF